jgi:DNA-binding NarL/FixJ family response regulator
MQTSPDASTRSPRPADRGVRVAIIEDEPEIRASLAQFVASFPNFSCVATCVSGEEAVRQIPPLAPDIVLMDIFLPRMSGIECTARLKAQLPDTLIVILTAVADNELIFLALEAGADGYLLKRTKPADLHAALLDVLNGGAPMTSQIARQVVRSFREKSKQSDEGVRLSTREEEVLVLLSRGFSNKEIADKLDLSPETISTYLKQIYKKMHVRSRTEAVARYLTTRSL